MILRALVLFVGLTIFSAIAFLPIIAPGPALAERFIAQVDELPNIDEGSSTAPDVQEQNYSSGPSPLMVGLGSVGGVLLLVGVGVWILRAKN
jgi:hypothetical protein